MFGMWYMYFSLSHPFVIVYCPVLIVSKNIPWLTYMYLFKYLFSCVTETHGNPSIFVKS